MILTDQAVAVFPIHPGSGLRISPQAGQTVRPATSGSHGSFLRDAELRCLRACPKPLLPNNHALQSCAPIYTHRAVGQGRRASPASLPLGLTSAICVARTETSQLQPRNGAEVFSQLPLGYAKHLAHHSKCVLLLPCITDTEMESRMVPGLIQS